MKRGLHPRAIVHRPFSGLRPRHGGEDGHLPNLPGLEDGKDSISPGAFFNAGSLESIPARLSVFVR